MTEKEKQQRREKIFMRVLGIFVVFLLVFIPVRYVYRSFQAAKVEMEAYDLDDDFDKNKLNFLFIAKKALVLFDEVKAENPHVEAVYIKRTADSYPAPTNDPTVWRWEISYRPKDSQPYTTIYKDISELEFLAYGAVEDAFSKHGGLSSVAVVNGDEVKFLCATSSYHIIYTKNFTLWYNVKSKNVYVERIDLKWFQKKGR